MSNYNERRAFMLIGGTVFVQDHGDERNAMQWAMEDFNITGRVWEELTRGHMTDTEVTFFTGGVEHNPDPYVGDDIIDDVVSTWRDTYGMPSGTCPDVFNGVFNRYGQSGERWPRVLKWDWELYKWVKAHEV